MSEGKWKCLRGLGQQKTCLHYNKSCNIFTWEQLERGGLSPFTLLHCSFTLNFKFFPLWQLLKSAKNVLHRAYTTLSLRFGPVIFSFSTYNRYMTKLTILLKCLYDLSNHVTKSFVYCNCDHMLIVSRFSFGPAKSP